MKRTSFIYIVLLLLAACKNEPVLSYNEAASDLPLETIGFNPLEGKLISSGIDTRSGTMFTLYGNDLAADHARTVRNSAYPDGAVLSKVTWKQEEDARWFGGNIPGALSAVEVVRFRKGTDGRPEPFYQHFVSSHPGSDTTGIGNEISDRIQSIAGIRASVMP